MSVELDALMNANKIIEYMEAELATLRAEVERLRGVIRKVVANRRDPHGTHEIGPRLYAECVDAIMEAAPPPTAWTREVPRGNGRWYWTNGEQEPVFVSVVAYDCGQCSFYDEGGMLLPDIADRPGWWHPIPAPPPLPSGEAG